MNNWYQRIAGASSYQNPMQRAQIIANAMRDPVSFVKQQFPDIPENIINDPNAILNYLQQTRGSKFAQDMQQVCSSQGR